MEYYISKFHFIFLIHYVTNLCKDGGKRFTGWKRLDKTKAFLLVLSFAVQICTANLIKLGTDSNTSKQSICSARLI